MKTKKKIIPFGDTGIINKNYVITMGTKDRSKTNKGKKDTGSTCF
jgi:hypothetical protein